MRIWTSIIEDFQQGREAIRGARYGVVETAGGRFQAVHLKPWPKLISWRDIWPVGSRYHASGRADRCLLYYNQPRSASSYLALKYVVSTQETSYATFRAALRVLDAIAELKQTDAIVCDAANSRISDRLLHRQGWEAHSPRRWRRNFIKRFYGKYPQTAWP